MLVRLRLLLAIVVGLAALAACGTAVGPGVELAVVVVGNGTVTSDPVGIDTSSSTTAEFSRNAVVTLTATPDTGHRFVSWEGCTGLTNTCAVTMNVARSVTANFAAIIDPVTPPIVNVVVTGNGTVVSDPAGIETPATATFEFDEGTEVTLTATPGQGAQFIGWGGACAAAGTESTCDLTMDGTKNVEANFGTDGVPVTITSALAANTDDAEEFLADSLANPVTWQEGYTFVTSSGLELGYDPAHGPQVVGLRFTGIDLPAGAQITSARLNFTARTANGQTGQGTPTFTIHAQESITAPTFAPGTVNQAGNFNITDRPLVDTTVQWAITQNWTAGTTYASPDLSMLLQEVVDLGDWGPTSAVLFVIKGDPNSTAYRRAVSRDTDPALAVTLTIVYTLP